MTQRNLQLFKQILLVNGIGCALLQSGKPVAYASKAVQAHEQGYVALEREALAVAWTLEKHHHFLYGQHFTLETDQKCLETILNRRIVEWSPRLQHIITRVYPMTSKSNASKERTMYLATACHAYQQDQISSQQAKSTSQESLWIVSQPMFEPVIYKYNAL